MTNGNDGCRGPTKTLPTVRSVGVVAPSNSPSDLVADVTDHSAKAPRRVPMTSKPTRKVVVAITLLLVSTGCSAGPVTTPSSDPTLTAAPLATPTAAATFASLAPTTTASPVPILPTLGPTTAPTLTPTIPPAANGWRPVPAQASVSADQFSDVAWTGLRFVALGFDSVLHSRDGLTWHRQAGDGGDHLAAGPLVLVATGWTNDLKARFSADGLTWTVRAGAFAISGAGSDDITVTAVVATDAGWLAVGRADPGGCSIDCGTQPLRAIVWTSADGLHWTRVGDQTSFAHAAMTGVTRGGPGFVAVGHAGNHGVVWTSTDGQAWSRVPDAAVFHTPSGIDPSYPAVMTDVTAAGGTIVAIGNVYTQNGGGTALAWWSTDGRTWSRAIGHRFLDGQTNSVAAIPGAFRVAGGGVQCNPGLGWSSGDGREWRCVTDPAFVGFTPYAIAASPNLMVVVGFGIPGDDTAGAIWVRPIS